MIIENILAAVLWCAAGVGLFFYLLNHWVLRLKDYRAKAPLLLLAFAVLTLGALGYGFKTGYSPQVWIPAAIMVLFVLGEIRRLGRRWRMQAAGPVAQDNVAVALRRPLRTTTLALRRYEVPRPRGWRGGRLRVALVSDLHLNGLLPDAYYQMVMERVTATQPDLILLTGDFVCRPEFAEKLPALLGGLRSRRGVFAILGNHDYWADGPRVVAALRQAGVVVLGNGTRRLEFPAADGEPDGARVTAGAAPAPAAGGGAALTLWGCEDPWGAGRWQPPTPSAAADHGLVLALSHTADNIFRLSQAGAFAVFAGHYHAGQWQLPGLGPLMVPSRYGRLFPHGHFRVRGTHLFVTAGIGTTRIPFRLYCQPDVFVVDFN
ncbi:MAG: metallophosphoesterase [Kiritimatiellaeota bacterium]|nr:metallophosphoesterase [Kiritimatiellota bacterium]